MGCKLGLDQMEKVVVCVSLWKHGLNVLFNQPANGVQAKQAFCSCALHHLDSSGFFQSKDLCYIFICMLFWNIFHIFYLYEIWLQLRSVWCCKMCKHVPAPLTALENVQFCQHHYIEFKKKKIRKKYFNLGKAFRTTWQRNMIHVEMQAWFMLYPSELYFS